MSGPTPRELLRPLHCIPQLHLLRLAHPQPLQKGKDFLVASLVLSELVEETTGQIGSSCDSSMRSTGAPPKASCTAGSCLKSPSSRNRTCVAGDVGPQPHVELRHLLDDQPVQKAAPRADCTQWSAVWAPIPRFGTEE